MAESSEKGVLLMAVFMLTRDDIRACANELGMPEEQLSDDVIELVKEKVSQGLGDWRELIKGVVKEAIKCPLDLACSPSCAWREVCYRTSPRGVK